LDATIDELVTHKGERSITDLSTFEVDVHKCDISESITEMSTLELADQGGGLYECMECDSENDISASLIVGRNVVGEGNEVSANVEVNPSNVDPPFAQQASILQEMAQSLVNAFPEFIFSLATGSDQPLLQISQRQLHNHPPFGMVSRMQITVQYNCCIAYVMMRKWESDSLTTVEDLTTVCLKFSMKSQYKFCPGINSEQYEAKYFKFIRFHIKNVRRTEYPFYRIDSVKCLLWFKLAHNATACEKAASEVRCMYCKRLVTDVIIATGSRGNRWSLITIRMGK